MLVNHKTKDGRYGCLMMMFDFQSGIEDIVHPADMDEVEDEPHVTVLYGIHGAHGPTPQNFMIPDIYRKMPVLFERRITVFEGKTDVLKISVESAMLREFREYVKATFVWSESGFSEYNPHLTLAFVKGGTGKKYEGIRVPYCSPTLCDVRHGTGFMYKENGVRTMV